MADRNQAFERAIKLAMVSGLRTMLGPAILAASREQPERQALAAAAIGEMVVDKIPGVPSRSSLPLLIPRALAGAWVAKTVMEDEGIEEPWAMPLGAAVAAGTAVLAPKVRGLLHAILRLPQPMLGLAEDYLALKLGGQAVGLSMDDMRQIAEDAADGVKGRIMPAMHSIGAR